jgi:hypothetical protein
MSRLKFLLALFFLICFSASAQDVIIKKNGNRINCRIVQVDSTALHYAINNGPVFQIPRSDVERYFLSKRSAPLVKPGDSSSVHSDRQAEARKRIDLFLFSLSGGLAHPIGEFGSMNVSSEASGLAMNGGALETMLSLRISKFGGLMAGFRYQSNPFNHDRIDDYLESLYPYLRFRSKSTPWIMRGIFGGLEFNLPINRVKGLSVGVSGLIGLPKYTMYSLTTNVYGNGAVVITQHKSSAHALTTLAGLTVTYKLARNIAVRAGMGYLQSSVSFKDILTVSTNGYSSYGDYKQEVTSLNFQAGAVIILQD